MTEGDDSEATAAEKNGTNGNILKALSRQWRNGRLGFLKINYLKL
jgi:hypothetical protein